MKWTRNVRLDRGRTPAERLEILDLYIRASRAERWDLCRRYALDRQTPQQWAIAYYGQTLRDLRRQLGLPSQ